MLTNDELAEAYERYKRDSRQAGPEDRSAFADALLDATYGRVLVSADDMRLVLSHFAGPELAWPWIHDAKTAKEKAAFDRLTRGLVEDLFRPPGRKEVRAPVAALVAGARGAHVEGVLHEQDPANQSRGGKKK